MNTTKKWYQSQTIWAMIVGIIALAAKAAGVVDPSIPQNADVNTAVGYVAAVKAAHGSVTALIPVIVAFGTFVWGLYGRITATAAISTATPAP